jgi:hypothetical protein
VSADIIVSYDGTPNDDDALALGRALAGGGATLALAYVRHSREFDPRREELAQHDAHRRLHGGAELLGDPSVATHVIFSASTDDGLGQLATSEGASVIVFGSDYRTAPGRAEPGNTAQRMLDGGPLAIAVARAGLRLQADQPIGTVTAFNPRNDPIVEQTVTAIANKLGAEVIPNEGTPVDLIVVGSQPGSVGRVTLGGPDRAELNAARSSVLVLAGERPVEL